jgi:hypothetical protein
MGAAGAVEAVLTVQALADDVVPPTLNLENLDPEVDLDVVAGKTRHDHYRGAVTNSFGLGGITSLWSSARNDPRQVSLCQSELSNFTDAAPEEIGTSRQVTAVALVDQFRRDGDRVVTTRR